MRPKLLPQFLPFLALITVWASQSPAAWAQTVSFVAAPSFPAGTSPTSVAAGNFKGDAFDLAVTNQHGVSILLNDGSGHFGPPVNYVVGTNPQSVVAGFFRFNSAGLDDLAVVNQGSGTVSILLNNGDGTFSSGATYTAGVNPHKVVTIDLNRDNNRDLIVVDSGAGPGTSGVSILLGNGDGTFKPAVFYAAGSVSLSVAIGDFNGDNNLDLAVANEGSDNISILFGKGDGTFQPPVNIPLDEPGISVSPTSIVAGLFDSNLNVNWDLAVATPNTRDITILLGKGDGTFAPPVHQALDDPNFVNNANELAAWDLNGDRKPDLVLYDTSSNHVTVLLGKGDGTFPSAISYAAGPQPSGILATPYQFDIDGTRHLDFNGDGTPDLVVANNAVDGEVTLLLGNGDGTLQAAPLRRSGFVPTSLAVGDFDGDGKLDLVTASSVTPAPAGIGTGVVMLGNADGTFQAPKIWSTSAISSVAVGDFDSDGKLDLVETNPTPGNGNVSVLLGKSDGTFQSAVNYTAGTTPQTVAVGDFNGDGKPDLVVGNHGSGSISILMNAGGIFQSAVDYSTPATGTPDSVAVGDFDGDGKPDIAVAISGINATSIAIFLGNGNGTFQSYLTIPSGFHSSGTLHIVAADFDGDGKDDIAVTDGATLSILLGYGNAAFQSPVTYLVGPGAAINGTLVVGDFNSDGKPDLVATSRDGLAIFINNGNGTFPTPIAYSPFLGGAIAVGDFYFDSFYVTGFVTGDGRPSIVAADSSQDSIPADTIAVLRNTSQIPVTFTVTSSPITGVSVIVADSNFDGLFTTPHTFTVNAGTAVSFSSFDYFPQPPGIGYLFSSWSDGEPNYKIRIVESTTTYTANMATTYELFAVASPPPGGAIAQPNPDTYDSLGNPFFRAGSVVSLTATPNAGYKFTGWTGPVADPSNPSTTMTMTGPETVTANFAVQQVAVPNVIGQTQATASAVIMGASLVIGNITSATSNTVAAGNVISESPVAETLVDLGSSVTLVVSTGPAVVPHVVSFSVLFGSQTYNVTTSARTRLPWQITGIRVVFSEPIASGGATSLTGAAVTGFAGLRTNTLTWTITPIPIGNVAIALSGSGVGALKDAAGNALNAGAGFNQALKILWGDFNNDGAVSASDLVLVNNARSAPYNIFADLNGDGVVDIADVQVVRNRTGTSLP